MNKVPPALASIFTPSWAESFKEESNGNTPKLVSTSIVDCMRSFWHEAMI